MQALKRILLLVLIVVAGHSVAVAQQQIRAAVYLQNNTDDPVGRLLAYEIREAIRRSAGLTLVDRDVDARFILRLVTIDPDRERSPGISTVYSAVYTVRTLHDTPIEMYLESSVGTCGSSRVESCGRRMAANLDEKATEFRALLRNALESRGSRN